jgi:hypothetical protein
MSVIEALLNRIFVITVIIIGVLSLGLAIAFPFVYRWSWRYGVKLGHYEEAKANAHLIAAAPTMFEALQAIFEDLDGRYDGAPNSPTLWMGEHITRIAQALKAAEGIK